MSVSDEKLDEAGRELNSNPFEAALKRLDLLQLATADELEKHGKELDAMTAAWRHLEK